MNFPITARNPSVSVSLLSQAVHKLHVPLQPSPSHVEEHKSRLILKFKTHNRNIAKSSVCLCFSKSLLCELRIKALTNKSGQPSDKDKSGWYVEPSVLEDTQNLVYGPYLAIPQFHSRSALASYSRTGPYTAHLLAGIFFPVTIK